MVILGAIAPACEFVNTPGAVTAGEDCEDKAREARDPARKVARDFEEGLTEDFADLLDAEAVEQARRNIEEMSPRDARSFLWIDCMSFEKDADCFSGDNPGVECRVEGGTAKNPFL